MNKFIFKKMREAMDADQKTIDGLYKKIRGLEKRENIEESHVMPYRAPVLAVVLITVTIGIFTGIIMQKNLSEIKPVENIESAIDKTEEQIRPETDKEENPQEIVTTMDRTEKQTEPETKPDKEEESGEIPTTTDRQKE